METAKIKIMFVDDEYLLLKALRQIPDPEHFEVVTANDGLEALELLKRQPVDIIVSDFRMPHMNGMELLIEAKVFYPDVIRILLTGQGDMQLLADAINFGEIFRFMPKPVKPAELNEVLEEAVARVKQIRSCSGAVLDERDAEVRELEKAFPGITQVDRDPNGAIKVADADLLPDQPGDRQKK